MLQFNYQICSHEIEKDYTRARQRNLKPSLLILSLFSLPQELQHEVSSLLEFKNALLETFPHLQGKLGGAASSPRLNYTSPPPSSSSRTSSSTLRAGHPHPVDHQRHHLHETHPPTTVTRAGGTAITRHDSSSDEIPGSWNGPTHHAAGANNHTGGVAGQNTLSRTKPRVRKSYEGSSAGSNIIDSGFSTETNNTTMTKDISSILGSGAQATPRAHNQPLDVRWDTWEGGPPGSPPEQDELLFLLDVIHRKTAKLKKEADSKVRQVKFMFQASFLTIFVASPM